MVIDIKRGTGVMRLVGPQAFKQIMVVKLVRVRGVGSSRILPGVFSGRNELGGW